MKKLYCNIDDYKCLLIEIFDHESITIEVCSISELKNYDVYGYIVIHTDQYYIAYTTLMDYLIKYVDDVRYTVAHRRSKKIDVYFSESKSYNEILNSFNNFEKYVSDHNKLDEKLKLINLSTDEDYSGFNSLAITIDKDENCISVSIVKDNISEKMKNVLSNNGRKIIHIINTNYNEISNENLENYIEKTFNVKHLITYHLNLTNIKTKFEFYFDEPPLTKYEYIKIFYDFDIHL